MVGRGGRMPREASVRVLGRDVRVRTIRELVGFDTNEALLADRVDGCMELVISGAHAKPLTHLRARPAPKRAREPNVPLPEERLRLVHPHAHGAVARQCGGAQSSLIHRMASLVNAAREALVPLGLIKSRGDAHVVRAEARGEGMHAQVEARMALHAQAESTHDRGRELLLGLDGEGLVAGSSTG